MAMPRKGVRMDELWRVMFRTMVEVAVARGVKPVEVWDRTADGLAIKVERDLYDAEEVFRAVFAGPPAGDALGEEGAR
jgi:hypothetical protein